MTLSALLAISPGLPGGCRGLGEDEADHLVAVQQGEPEVEAERAADAGEDAQPREAQLAAQCTHI